MLVSGICTGGVFHGCDRNFMVNHAVVIAGYGTDTALKMDYWLIRNPWGPDWGESGFIRIQRHSTDESDKGWSAQTVIQRKVSDVMEVLQQSQCVACLESSPICHTLLG
ncbi:unnamed protein product [Polarella glacialis]|uniref:Peptidase C1A papain C-terminal domain-containing protein n=1 Tax=Polarella glacialis TaxID=89957 RepID=A0A813DBD9_POLGL|nr:unnamed protein product [Polarella glacialis]